MKDIMTLIEKHIDFIPEEELPIAEEGTENITNDWQLVIKDFLDELNKGRGKGTKWKEYTAGRLMGMLGKAGMSKQGYRNFLVDCQKANNFSAFFHWKLKQIKSNNK